MLVQVIGEFDHPIVERAAHTDVIDQRNVLTVFAETDSSRMRTYRHTELRREQQDGKRLAEAAETAIVELAEIDRTGLHQLLEHHAIGRMLSGRDSYRLNRAANRRVTEHVVGAGRLFDPQ